MSTPYNPSYPYQPFQPLGQAGASAPYSSPAPACLAYVYKPDQPAYNHQPQLANATIVVAGQPVTTTTTGVYPPKENSTGIVICALVFSLCTLFTCGASVICLSLSIPALILAIVALGTRGNSQKTNAGISIGLNVAVVVCTMFLLLVVVTSVTVTTAGTRYCSAYYSSTYRTRCAPYSYSTRGSCTYYDLYYYNYIYGGYCPT